MSKRFSFMLVMLHPGHLDLTTRCSARFHTPFDEKWLWSLDGKTTPSKKMATAKNRYVTF